MAQQEAIIYITSESLKNILNGPYIHKDTYWDVGYLGDWLHPFHGADGDLWNPEGTRHMRPLLP